MRNEKKFWIKLAVMAVLILALKGLKLGNVSNLRDFFTGLVMGVIVVVLLWLVYSVIAQLRGTES